MKLEKTEGPTYVGAVREVFPEGMNLKGYTAFWIENWRYFQQGGGIWATVFDAGMRMSAFSSLVASLVAQLVKNLPAMQETPVQFLDQEDPLEKE